jgi:UDP-4-amino-4,6-dideoxy-N-acetyl-beta-L-altrosamine transaminase
MTYTPEQFLSYGKQWISDEDISAVNEVLRSDYLTQGPKVKEFEDAICEYTGAKYCVAVANGTAALHLAVASLKIPKGNEGITSPNTFAASANCMLYNGLTPRFADIDPKTYIIDPYNIPKLINEKTKLLIPVHFAGQAANMEKIQSIAQKHNLYVIEDAAHAIGSQYANGSYVGNCKYSDLTTFSFHPVKTITTSEGGAITTNSKELYERLLLLRSHGITKDNSKFKIQNSKLTGPWYYEMQELGYNYRLTDMQAALGLSQLKRLNEFKARRREIVQKYNKAFADIDWLTTPYEAEGLSSCLHLYVLKMDFQKIGKTRTEVMEYLASQKIGTQVHYIPVNKLPFHSSMNKDYCPVTDNYYNECLSIPLYPRLSNGDVLYIIDRILNLK